MNRSLILIVLAMTSMLCADNSNHSALFASSDAGLNLEEMEQDFVLEVKQLEIPGYPTACNPSIGGGSHQDLFKT